MRRWPRWMASKEVAMNNCSHLNENERWSWQKWLWWRLWIPRPSSIIEMSASLWENGKFEPQQRWVGGGRWRKCFPSKQRRRRNRRLGSFCSFRIRTRVRYGSTTNSEGSGSNEGNVFEDQQELLQKGFSLHQVVRLVTDLANMTSRGLWELDEDGGGGAKEAG